MIAVVGAYLFARIGTPGLYGNDPSSDANALTAGKHFGEDGFIRLRFLPVVTAGPLPPTPTYYTHYPPLPDLICGVLYRLGARNLATFRLLPTVASLAALWVAYLLLRLFMTPAFASWATVMMGTSSAFLLWCQSTHQHAYYQFVLFTFLYLLLAPIVAGKRRHPYLLWALLLAQSLLSFEYYLFCLTMLGAVAAIRQRIWTRQQLAGIASALFIGFGIHLAQNAWALGWQGAVRDLTAAAIKRTAGSSIDTTSLEAWPHSILPPLVLHYLPAWCAYVAALPLVPYRRWLTVMRQTSLLWWAMGLASITFWVAMRQHSAYHEHDVRHAMLFVFGCAGGLLGAMHRLRRDHAAVVIASVALAISIHQGVRSIRNDTRCAQRLPAALQALLPSDHLVWTNYIAPSVWMYYLGRPVVQVDDANSGFFAIHGVDIGRPLLPMSPGAVPPIREPVAFVLDTRHPMGPALQQLLRGAKHTSVPGIACLRVFYLSAARASRRPAQAEEPTARWAPGLAAVVPGPPR